MIGCIYDNERAKFNPNNKFLTINLAKAENVRGDNNSDTSRDVDFLSNGFKIRNTASTLNLNSRHYLLCSMGRSTIS